MIKKNTTRLKKKVNNYILFNIKRTIKEVKAVRERSKTKNKKFNN